jgi:hypothetical protein
MFSVLFTPPDSSRLDQCDNPVSRGGLHVSSQTLG